MPRRHPRQMASIWDLMIDGEFLHVADANHWVEPNGEHRSKLTHPYSYSEFYIFGGPAGKVTADGADYSDRLWSWNHDKADRLWKQHVNCRWDMAGREKLSAFMSEYHGIPLQVVALAEGCNISNGYPYWIVWWRKLSPTQDKLLTE